ncbi:MAG: porin family protein [Rhodanobacter sp.]|mgnify:CR=1 FL=1|jgi:OOP family OmpA-OmpF porin/outer membrane immunogenic protein|uniref:Porin family protein n=1 Tax=Rhodanobacter glycinis TaxID=582702 RepID=A0A5B9E412_9GAMM|nr:porin family protein [Rhodanobacter glycinis]QEE25765.1 porin family protein [Rhodanobacter glycinis]TAM24993.1 MAG: porin family protein [Rhodanobacter sp.]
MKKSLLALAFATAGLMAAPAVFAQSAPNGNGGWFVNGNVGRTSINKGPYDGHDTGYGINGGYRWAVSPSVALGAEIGYNDLGNIHAKNIFNGNRVVDRQKTQLHGWTAGVNGHFNISPNWYVSARTGIYGWKGHGMSNDELPTRHSVDDTSWYAGAGFGYDFTNNFSLGLNYDYYNAKKHNVDLSTDMVSVSAEYRF